MANELKTPLAEKVAKVLATLEEGDLNELNLEGFKRVGWEIIVMRAKEIQEENKSNNISNIIKENAMNAKDLRKTIQKMYSRLNYDQFCEYMGFNSKYGERYWDDFQNLANALSKFDDTSLQKIIDFAKTEKS